MKFDASYTKYWSSTINKSVDGTIIAGERQVNEVLSYLDLPSGNSSALDLGCSFGRMCEVLKQYAKSIYGIDVDPSAVDKAKALAYEDVRQGSGEDIPFDDAFFDLVFCWAVFDVVQHLQGLIEINRVLKGGAKMVITGKNDRYFDDDILAFTAEKNAFLKGFPNKFTDLSQVVKSLPLLGFQLDSLLLFPRRGDVGLVNFIDTEHEDLDTFLGYEYVLFATKTHESSKNELRDKKLDSPVSKSSEIASSNAGFDSVSEYFNSLGID